MFEYLYTVLKGNFLETEMLAIVYYLITNICVWSVNAVVEVKHSENEKLPIFRNYFNTLS